MCAQQPIQHNPKRRTNSPSPSGQDLFEILFLENADMLETYLRTLLRESVDLDDIFQETMLVAYRRLGEYDRNRPFGAWIRGIARILVLEHSRKQRSRTRTSDPHLLQQIEARFLSLEQRNGDTFRERTQSVLECVEKLPQSFKQSIELVYVRGLSISQASVAISTGQEAMKKRVQRARAMIAKCLGLNSSS